MNHKFLIGLTAILVLGVGKAVASELEENLPSSQQSPEQTTEVKEIEQAQPNSATQSLKNADVTVYPHQWEKYSAATLYIRGIPVLTFLGSKAEDPQDDYAKNPLTPNTNSDGALENPVGRAQKLASRLSQLIEEKADSNTITVGWNQESKSYSIKIKDEELVKINEKTILPDTTHKVAEDALQATNRLRRLIGDAPPLQAIAGITKKGSVALATKAPHTLRPAISKPVATRVTRQFGGLASWYGKGFHGRRTANGERYNQYGLTAAHKSLPFGTIVRVTNINNGRSVIVRINDRGPFVGRRVIDLSAGAAQAIGMLGSGVAPVRIEVLSR